jgi:hypothetical protein
MLDGDGVGCADVMAEVVAVPVVVVLATVADLMVVLVSVSVVDVDVVGVVDVVNGTVRVVAVGWVGECVVGGGVRFEKTPHPGADSCPNRIGPHRGARVLM